MRAMILAAGLGTRLRPLTDYIPKPLLPVVGVPNIVRVIHLLKKAGVRDIVINLHHLPEMIESALGSGDSLGVAIEYTREPVLLGTAGGIRNALAHLGKETFIVINGDSFYAPDIGKALAYHKKVGALATLVVRSDPRAESYGAVGMDGTGKVVRLAWVKSGVTAESLGMFTGVHIMEPSFAEELPASGCIVRKTYMPLIEQGAPIFGFFNDGWFFDLGTPSDYLHANLALLRGQIALDGFSPPPGEIFTGQGLELGENARLLPGAILGNHVRVAPGTTVERAVVLDGAHVQGDVRDAVVVGDDLIPAARE